MLPMALACVLLMPAAASRPMPHWREPARTFPAGQAWRCETIRWADGDTLTARCAGLSRPVSVRLRGLDTPERGERRYREAGAELRRRPEGREIEVRPHHRSWERVVGDVLVAGVDVGQEMDGAGWSKPGCPRRSAGSSVALSACQRWLPRVAFLLLLPLVTQSGAEGVGPGGEWRRWRIVPGCGDRRRLRRPAGDPFRQLPKHAPRLLRRLAGPTRSVARNPCGYGTPCWHRRESRLANLSASDTRQALAGLTAAERKRSAPG